jgi:hypothetical protein
LPVGQGGEVSRSDFQEIWIEALYTTNVRWGFD